MDSPPAFVDVVVCVAVSFGLWEAWYHYRASPRELAERRKAKLAKQYQKRVNSQRGESV